MKKMICCPRCNWKSFERLKTYSHCSNCFYSEDNILEFYAKDLFDIEVLTHSKNIIKDRDAMLAALYEF